MDNIEQLITMIDNYAFAAYEATHQGAARAWALQATDLLEELIEFVCEVPAKERAELLNRATQHVTRAWKNASTKPF